MKINTKNVTIVAVFGACLYRFNGFWFATGVGSLINVVIAKVFKKLFAALGQDKITKRPYNALEDGFPSSHLHMYGYFFSQFFLHSTTAYEVRKSVVLFMILIPVVIYERVYVEKQHDFFQSFAGVLSGILCGWFYFLVAIEYFQINAEFDKAKEWFLLKYGTQFV